MRALCRTPPALVPASLARLALPSIQPSPKARALLIGVIIYRIPRVRHACGDRVDLGPFEPLSQTEDPKENARKQHQNDDVQPRNQPRVWGVGCFNPNSIWEDAVELIAPAVMR